MGAFEGRVAVVTGASSGIGRALARELAGRGAKVGLIARRQFELDELKRSIAAAGGTAEYAVADVSDRRATLTAFAELAGRLGPVDLMVANAGLGAETTLKPMNVETVERIIRTNLLGTVYSVEAVLPSMLERGRGHLAAVSSLAAFKGLPGHSGYCASKAGVSAYMEGLRIQLREFGVRVTTVCPGFVTTPMIEHKPHRKPFEWSAEKAARGIARALARGTKVYAFPRPMYLALWASKWAPDWLVRRVVPDGV